MNEPIPTRIRARAIILGLLLIVPIGRWLFEGEIVRYTFATWAAPFYNAIFVLFWLTLANMGLGKLFRKPPLNNLELLAVYVMVSVSSALMSTDYLGILITMIGYPTRYATSTNEWDRMFHGLLPNWLYVTDKQVLKGFYEGSSSFWTAQNLQAWSGPMLMWSIFISALFVAFLCISILMRKQWVDAERLTFPIIQLPMAMTHSPSAFFSNRLMWLGFAISGGITLLNGMHYLYPNYPFLAIQRQSLPLFDVAPWDAVPSVKISFYFFAITLGFLMPLDLSVSLYGFFFLYLLQQIVAKSMGFDPVKDLRTDDQAWGAYMAIAVFVLLGARAHLVRAFKTAFLRGDPEYDKGEPVSYRTAYLGLFISFVVMVVFLVAIGMTLWIAILALGVLLALALVVTRIRAELGFPVHDLHGMGPHGSLPRLLGTANMPKHSLAAIASIYWAERVMRSHPMPHQMEGLKLSSESARSGRDMLKAILIAGIFTIVVTFVVYLDGFYRLGAATARVNMWGTGYASEAFSTLENWLRNPEALKAGNWGGAIVGFGLTAIMMIARSQIIGFPLHPLGYAVANSWGIWQLWLPIMIGSTCKAVTLKTGGLTNYRKGVMFFFGLMLGEFVVGCGWTIIGILIGKRTYDFWPG